MVLDLSRSMTIYYTLWTSIVFVVWFVESAILWGEGTCFHYIHNVLYHTFCFLLFFSQSIIALCLIFLDVSFCKIFVPLYHILNTFAFRFFCLLISSFPSCLPHRHSLSLSLSLQLHSA